MTTKALGGVIAAIIGLVGFVCAGAGMLFSGAASMCTTPLPSGASALIAPAGGWQPIGRFDAEQVGLAATIISVGVQMGVPVRGLVIAVATALQESDLRNLTGGDLDSIGLFQQRPGQGWGSPQQLHNPTYASQKFFAKLLTIPGWPSMALTDAAQDVQRSGHPNAYAKHEPDATLLVNTVGSASFLSIPGNLEQCLTTCPSALADDGTSGPTTGCLSGEAVLARAATWLTAWNGDPVPYLSSPDSTTWFGGYRRDCSGYASMALGLAGPGLDTAGLAARSTPIPKADLRPGDLLINPAPDSAGHVVIFDHWTNTTMTSYVGYEQSGDGGTHHRVIPYPYFGGYPMSPYRLRK